MVVVLVKYECRENCARAFVNAAKAQKIDECSRNEAGNIRYDYAFDADSENVVILTEIWKDQAALDAHAAMPHFAALGAIKAEYVLNTVIRKFDAEPRLGA